MAECNTHVIIWVTKPYPGNSNVFLAQTTPKTRKSMNVVTGPTVQATIVEGSGWPTIRAGGNCSFEDLATVETTNPLNPPLAYQDQKFVDRYLFI